MVRNFTIPGPKPAAAAKAPAPAAAAAPKKELSAADVEAKKQLEAQIKKLEQELERKRLEEQIKQLEEQMKRATAANNNKKDNNNNVSKGAASTTATPAPTPTQPAPSSQPTPPQKQQQQQQQQEEYDDEEEEEVIVIEEIIEDDDGEGEYEIVEEYEEEEEEEEIIEEEYEEEVVEDEEEVTDNAPAPAPAAPVPPSPADIPESHPPPKEEPKPKPKRSLFKSAPPEKPAAAAEHPLGKGFKSWPPPKNAVQEEEAHVVVAPPAPAPAAEPEAPAGKPRSSWVPLSQRKPELFQNQKDPAKYGVGTTTTGGGSGLNYSQKGRLPPLKFTRRTIPDLPASKAGSEIAMEKLLGPKLLTSVKMTKANTFACLHDRKLVGLYFAAKWRTECKRFNPVISDFFKMTANDFDYEIVYISVDRTLFEFKDAFGQMPFLALPTGTTQIKNNLAKSLKIVELPALVIFDAASGNVVTTSGAVEVADLEERNPDQAHALVQKWLSTKPIPMSQVSAPVKLENCQKGTIFWTEA